MISIQIKNNFLTVNNPFVPISAQVIVECPESCFETSSTNILHRHLLETFSTDVKGYHTPSHQTYIHTQIFIIGCCTFQMY